MEVIGAGWGRTGTLSLKTALDILDMPCYHMVDLMKHEDHSLLWLKLAEGEEVDCDVLLSGYKAVVDWPACSFYKQLMEQYPTAKVILTVRDPAKWYQSAKETIHKVNQVMLTAPWYVRHFPLPKPGGPHHRKMINTVIWENDLQGCFEADPEKAQQLFQQHIEEVKQFVPADRLLVFRVTDGWEPLCKFLGKPVPDQPFPHVNDAATWKSMIAKFEAINQMLTYAIPAGAVAIISAVAAAVMARRSRA